MVRFSRRVVGLGAVGVSAANVGARVEEDFGFCFFFFFKTDEGEFVSGEFVVTVDASVDGAVAGMTTVGVLAYPEADSFASEKSTRDGGSVFFDGASVESSGVGSEDTYCAPVEEAASMDKIGAVVGEMVGCRVVFTAGEIFPCRFSVTSLDEGGFDIVGSNASSLLDNLLFFLLVPFFLLLLLLETTLVGAGDSVGASVSLLDDLLFFLLFPFPFFLLLLLLDTTLVGAGDSVGASVSLLEDLLPFFLLIPFCLILLCFVFFLLLLFDEITGVGAGDIVSVVADDDKEELLLPFLFLLSGLK